MAFHDEMQARHRGLSTTDEIASRRPSQSFAIGLRRPYLPVGDRCHLDDTFIANAGGATSSLPHIRLASGATSWLCPTPKPLHISRHG
jgi:hypothetical protein